MQAQLLVGPITPINGSDAFSTINLIKTSHLISSPCSTNRSANRRPHHRLVVASSSAATAALNGGQDHYAALGVSRSATSADIKRAYRLLARKYHPDVSKDSRAPEAFKTIHRAYEVLSNEETRTKYDQALKFQTDTTRSYRGTWSYGPEFKDGIRIYKWAELRRKMQYEKYWKHYNSNEENFSFCGESIDEEVEEENLAQERGSFSEVLKSAFISLFLLKILGSQLSLAFSSLTALLDKKLDAGYKIGYLIAWIMGGRGGILLTICLSFASWVCGKTSSGVVVLIVVAMWIGSNLARYAPLPHGALLALLYMSLKLQADSS